MATSATSRLPRVDLLHVHTPDGLAGRLTKSSQHAFTYETAALDRHDRGLEVSLTMPLRPESYIRTPMLPVFQTFLPEGFLRERIAERFGKILRLDDMALLAATGDHPIGRLRLTRSVDSATEASAVESLAEILQDQGSQDLFAYLCDKYLIGSGIAGVQPKVLVPVADPVESEPVGESAVCELDHGHGVADASSPSARNAAGAPARDLPGRRSIGERATLRTRKLIVKVSGDDFPGLAENEFHCLSIARCLGLEVPAFWLSADRKRLVVERFDYDPVQGRYLGFEDMVSLQGSVNERKYEGSYESVARAIAVNAAPGCRRASLHAYYASLVLSMTLRNGDAHLKNFGMLYTDPGSDDCRLSPTYDIVCTTIYLPKDQPALALDGRRAWPEPPTLAEFGRRHCMVERPDDVIQRTIDAVHDYEPDDDETGIWARIASAADAH